jgi:hypothetical protein
MLRDITSKSLNKLEELIVSFTQGQDRQAGVEGLAGRDHNRENQSSVHAS